MKNTIYLLTNKVNGKVYVGRTLLSLKKRMGNGDNYKNSVYLYGAIQKHGVSNFEYTVLGECDTQEEADLLESNYIQQYNSRDPEIGYNIKEGGSTGKHSKETKQKISENSPKYWLGKTLSDDIKNKISIANMGNTHTEEWKEENSERMKEWHENNEHPMLGKLHSDEAKEKIGLSSKGRKMSEETIEKRKQSRIDPELDVSVCKAYLNGTTINEIRKMFDIGGNGKIYRILKRNNIELTNDFSKWSGKTHSEETKSKMSEARSKFWDNKI